MMTTASASSEGASRLVSRVHQLKHKKHSDSWGNGLLTMSCVGVLQSASESKYDIAAITIAAQCSSCPEGLRAELVKIMCTVSFGKLTAMFKCRGDAAQPF